MAARLYGWLLLSAFLIFFHQTPLRSQSHQPPSRFLRQPLEFRHLTVEQGLTQNSVFCILQDRQGFMWFGTGDGLNRFDGFDIKAYRSDPADASSVVGGVIRALYEDSRGVLWIGSDEGLSRFDKNTTKFSRIAFGLKTPMAVNSLAGDSTGNLWIGGASGLFVLTPADTLPRMVLKSLNAWKMLAGRSGELWISSRGGVYRFDIAKGELTPCRTDSGSLAEATVWSLLTDNAGTIWAYSESARMYALDPARCTLKSIGGSASMQNLTKTRWLNFAEFDSSDLLWLATNGGGLIVTDRNATWSRRLQNDDRVSSSLSSDIVKCIFADRSGILWIGTDLGGVERVDPHPRKFGLYRHRENDGNSLSGDVVKAVAEDADGTLWVGTYGDGLNRISPDRSVVTSYRHNPADGSSIRSDEVTSLLRDSRSRLWIGTASGLDRFDRERGRFIHYRAVTSHATAPGSGILVITEDSSGAVWAGTDWTLDTVDEMSGSYRPAVIDTGTLVSTIYSLHVSGGGNLYAGASSGFFELHPQSRRIRSFITPGQATPTAWPPRINAIHEAPDGLFWLASSKGLLSFDRRNGEFKEYGQAEGLKNCVVYAVIGDDRGELWCSTNLGIYRLNPRTGRHRNYGTDDGLQSNEFNSGAFFKDSRGVIYFGGISGLNEFHPDSLRDNPVLPPVVLTGFKEFDEPAFPGGDISTIGRIRLSYQENIFSLQFAALEFTNPAKNQYAYRLEGFEQNWTFCGTRREVRYTHLDPGDYVFRVKASNNDGLWNEEGHSVRIIIVPPYWQTGWFRIAAAAAVLGLVGGSAQYAARRKMKAKIRSLEQEHALDRERARISKDMHDEVGANLTKISILTELALRKMTGGSEAVPLVQKISQSSREVLDSIGEIIWATNPKHDRLDDLAAYIREYASELLETAGKQFQIDVADDLPRINLSAEQRRNIFLVIKEALNNIVKHAGASHVGLTLSVIPEGFLLITVRDDGCGFDDADPGIIGNGLSNMPKRIQDVGGTFTISSAPGQGTSLRMRVPIRNTTLG